MPTTTETTPYQKGYSDALADVLARMQQIIEMNERLEGERGVGNIASFALMIALSDLKKMKAPRQRKTRTRPTPSRE